MHIQWKVSHRAQSINHERSNGNVWDKAAIHDVDMDPVTASHLYCFYLNKVKRQTVTSIQLNNKMQLKSTYLLNEKQIEYNKSKLNLLPALPTLQS